MNKRLMRFFIVSAGVLLLLTALAKLVSAAGSARALGMPDPVFLVPFRYVFLVVGLIEIVVAAICLFGRQIRRQAWLLAWLSACFLVYRVFLTTWKGALDSRQAFFYQDTSDFDRALPKNYQNLQAIAFDKNCEVQVA